MASLKQDVTINTLYSKSMKIDVTDVLTEENDVLTSVYGVKKPLQLFLFTDC